MTDHQQLIHTLTALMSRGEWSNLPAVMAADAVLEFPQSGEIFRGIDNIRGQFADYPNMPQGDVIAVEIVADQPTYVLSPSYTVISVGASGRDGMATLRARYPDGSFWWVLIVYATDGERLSGGKVYFAPEFEPPEWRTKYLDRSSRRTDGAR
ncbi:MAG: nuclear transport factor 2 family protein [Chloroflexota bacterium]